MTKQRFPGFGKDGTLVLPVAPAVWPPPRAGVTVDGIAFEPKRELHVTIVGSELGARVREAIGQWRLVNDDAVRAFETLDWRLTRRHELLLLAKDKPGGAAIAAMAASHGASAGTAGVRAMAIVELVTMPAMAAFHRWLASRIGVAPVVPPPHVTLYVHGDPAGIGVPTDAALAACTVRPLAPADLA